MFRINLSHIMIIGVLTLFSCNDPKVELVPATISSPPSITNNEAEIKSVQLNDLQASELTIKILEVRSDTIRFGITAPATVYPAPDNISIISAPVSGRISKIFAHEGEHVSTGTPLLEIESLEYANLLSDYLENKSELEYLAAQLERDRELVSKEITAQRTFERSQADFKRAETKLLASKARLLAIGISEEQLKTWDVGASTPNAKLIMYAPISGKVNEHLIDLGTSVNTHQKLLDIVDASSVLVRAFIAPEDATFIQQGTMVTLSNRAMDTSSSNSRIQTTVATVNPTLDAMNRAIPVNIIAKTVSGWPVIGQNVRALFSIVSAEAGMVIPISAVQFEKDGATVFVQKDANTYQTRKIVTGRISENEVIVISGLNEGEIIATSQVFSLKALAKFDEFAD